MKTIDIRLFLVVFIILMLPSQPSYSVEPSSEAELLKNSNGLAIRHGRALALTLANGKIKTLENCQEEFLVPKGCARYEYQGLIADNQFFIVNMWYAMDSNAFIAISRKSGTITTIENEPHVSPRGGFMLSSLATELEGINGVHLWAIHQGELKAIKVDNDDKMYGFIRWIDEKNAELKRYTYSDPGVKCGWIETRMRLSNQDHRWQLSEISPPTCSGN
jgi:hypothetical protein